MAQRDPEIRAVVAQGLDDGRALWARALYGLDADRADRGLRGRSAPCIRRCSAAC